MDLPEDVHMLSPMHLQVGQPVLVAILRDNLANIARNNTGKGSVEELLEMTAFTLEMKRFLKWARCQPGPNVLMAAYPVDPNECGVDDEDEAG